VLATSNRLLCEKSGDDRFVTLLMARPGSRQAVSDLQTMQAHPPGFILDSSGKVKAELAATGLPLGSFPQETYPNASGHRP